MSERAANSKQMPKEPPLHAAGTRKNSVGVVRGMPSPPAQGGAQPKGGPTSSAPGAAHDASADGADASMLKDLQCMLVEGDPKMMRSNHGAKGPGAEEMKSAKRRGRPPRWASSGDASQADAPPAPVPGAPPSVQLCCNRWEHLGGAFGCKLVAGHAGPHALQDLPSRRGTSSARAAAAAAAASAPAPATATAASTKPVARRSMAPPHADIADAMNRVPAELAAPGAPAASAAAAAVQSRASPLTTASRGASPTSSTASVASATSDARGKVAAAGAASTSAAAGTAAPPVDVMALTPQSKLHLFVWAQCDRCSKWRRLPPGMAPSEEGWWECSMNAKKALNDCSYPEEAMEENELAGERLERVRELRGELPQRGGERERERGGGGGGERGKKRKRRGKELSQGAAARAAAAARAPRRAGASGGARGVARRPRCRAAAPRRPTHRRAAPLAPSGAAAAAAAARVAAAAEA